MPNLITLNCPPENRSAFQDSRGAIWYDQMWHESLENI